MEVTPHTTLLLDGYRLIRLLGSGGFGEVWLCRSETVGGYHAIKLVTAAGEEQRDKEYQSLVLFREAAARIRSPHLVPIEHINAVGRLLYYVMPLADGTGADDPADPAWEPLSLATVLCRQASLPVWFSSVGIRAMFSPILHALQKLSEAGLVHRDVKSDNIMFFQGQPCLGDISLLGLDSENITRRGTPGYATPSWYRSGHPDMYGAAATLYNLLTGNPPDRMGRSAFLWPPQGENSLDHGERQEWRRLHGVVRRAAEESVAERFIDFDAMNAALVPGATTAHAASGRRRLPVVVVASVGAMGIAAGGLWWSFHRRGWSPAPVHYSGGAGAYSATAGGDDRLRQDASMAYWSLSAATAEGPMERDADLKRGDSLLTDSFASMSDCIAPTEPLDVPTMIRLLDECFKGCPALAARSNVELSRLLLLQCDGRGDEAARGLDNPAFLILKEGENLSYRVDLLCSLHAPEKAEKVIENLLDNPSWPGRKSYLLETRAQFRARFSRFAEAKADFDEAQRLESDHPEKVSELKMTEIKISKQIPSYGDYLGIGRKK